MMIAGILLPLTRDSAAFSTVASSWFISSTRYISPWRVFEACGGIIVFRLIRVGRDTEIVHTICMIFFMHFSSFELLKVPCYEENSGTSNIICEVRDKVHDYQ
jgi:hypothetical protein